jgi:hypothetical protein
MTQETTPARVITVKDLKQYLSIYKEDLQVVVHLPSGEFAGVLDMTTTVLQPGTVLALSLTTIKAISGRKVPPVIVT